MTTIYLNQEVNGTATNTEGYKLLVVLESFIVNDEKVNLSLKEATPMSSSFLNSSIGELMEKYGYNKVVELLSFSNVSRYSGGILKKYFHAYKTMQTE